MKVISNNGKNAQFELGPHENFILNNTTSGASTIIVQTSQGSETKHVIPPGGNVEVRAGNEALQVYSFNFTPKFEQLESA